MSEITAGYVHGMAKPFGPAPFGPSDFVIAFGQLCSLVPAAVIILNMPFYCFRAFRPARYTSLSLVLALKILMVGVLGATQINIVRGWWATSPPAGRLTQAAALASYASMPCMGLMVYFNHLHFVPSSPFLTAFMVITSLVDLGPFPTYFCPENSMENYRTFATLKLLVLLVEQLPKGPIIYQENEPLESQQQRSNGIMDTPLAKWLKSDVFFGFRLNIKKENPVDFTHEFDPAALHSRFSAQWNKSRKDSQYALLKAFLFAAPELLLASIFPRILLAGFNVSQPYLMHDVLVALTVNDVPAEVYEKLLATTAILYLGILCSNAWFLNATSRLQVSVKLALEAAIFNKCLTLDSARFDPAEASSMMNREVQRMTWLIANLCGEWADLLEVLIHVASLASIIGVAAVLVAVPTILATFLLSALYQQDRENISDAQRRSASHTAIVSNVLAQIKNVKVLGLSSSLLKRAARYQEDQIRCSVGKNLSWSWQIAAGTFLDTATPLAAVTAAFLGLSVFVPESMIDFSTVVARAIILTLPLSGFIRSLQPHRLAVESAQHLQQFLLRADVQDDRIVAPDVLHGDGLEALVGPHVLPQQQPQQQGQGFGSPPISEFVARFVNVSAGFDETNMLLRDINLSILRRKVTMLYGRIGSGKSTFLRMLVGRMRPNNGSLLVATKSIGYCGQTPWISNASIRDNIIGKNAYNRLWLTFVIYICALNIDLRRFADGDLTMAGSGGCNLSGGQRSRIALARALYAKKEIIVADDIFSSLDMETSSLVRVRLFGATLILKSYGITFIMATSMREHLVDADKIFEIFPDGTVREPDPQQYQAAPSHLPSVVEGGAQVTLENVEETVEASAQAEAAEDEEEGEDEGPALEPPEQDLIRVREAPNRERGDSSLYIFFFGPTGTFALCIWLLSCFTVAITERIPEIFVCLWMESAPSSGFHFMLYASFALVHPIFARINALCYHAIVYPRTARALYGKVADTTSVATYDFLMSTDASILLNKFCNDVSSTTSNIPVVVGQMIWGFISMSIYLLAYAWPTYSVVLPVMLLVLFWAMQVRYYQAIRQLGALHGAPGSRVSRLVAEASAGIEHIYSFEWQHALLLQFYQDAKELCQARYHNECLTAWLWAMSHFAATVVALFIVAVTLKSNGKASPTAVIFAYLNLISFTVQLRAFIQGWVHSDAALNGADDIRSFVTETPKEIDQIPAAEIPQEWGRGGKVEFNCVTAHYRPLNAPAHKALNRVTITVNPGQVVGIAGRSGSGKTTLLLSVLNLLDFRGSISIDDREIRRIPRQLLRSRITVMTQDGLELLGSVRFNMDPFDPALRPRAFILTDAMLTGILQRVGLWDHIERCGGLDARFSAMGFSYGQKKLFQLARAMLHKQIMRTKIIIIDEGAPNDEVEAHMRQVMQEAFTGCTILMVSHHPTLFERADFIVTMDRGKATIYEHNRQLRGWSASEWNS